MIANTHDTKTRAVKEQIKESIRVAAGLAVLLLALAYSSGQFNPYRALFVSANGTAFLY